MYICINFLLFFKGIDLSVRVISVHTFTSHAITFTVYYILHVLCSLCDV